MRTKCPHKRLRLGFSLGVALLMAVLSFGLGFHHHSDGASHDDCPLCVALQLAHSSSLSRPPAVGPVPLRVSKVVSFRDEEPVAYTPVEDPVIRPPPAS
jgi:hypothetical protein